MVELYTIRVSNPLIPKIHVTCLPAGRSPTVVKWQNGVNYGPLGAQHTTRRFSGFWADPWSPSYAPWRAHCAGPETIGFCVVYKLAFEEVELQVAFQVAARVGGEGNAH